MVKSQFLDDVLQEELRNLIWFAHAGDPPAGAADEALKNKGVIYLTQPEMIRAYAALPYQQALAGARNLLADGLSREHVEQFRQWNHVAKAAQRFFDEELVDIFTGHRETFGLSQAFPIWNRTTIIGIFLAAYYRPLQVNARFYDLALECYRAGRYPCGWVGGEFPVGNLAVW